MNTSPVSGQRNSILATLSPSDLTLLQPHLEPVPLKFRQRLQFADRPVTDVFFPESGLGSVVAVGRGDRQQAEVAVVGCEGMTGLPVVHDAGRSPYDVFMQVAGQGLRISAKDLHAAMDESASLVRCLLRYSHVFAVQASYTALANAHGKLEERLARWLLMAHDRIEGDTLSLTHEFLALMLGTRRAGVTLAVGNFESKGIVKHDRGSVTVKDRGGLLACAAGYYGVPEAEHKRLFQPACPYRRLPLGQELEG